MGASRNVLGLDMGHHAVKAVLATANGKRLRVIRAEWVPIPPDLPDPSGPLRRWVLENKLANTPVSMCVGGSRVLYQTLRLEPEDPRRPDQIAAMEAMRFRDITDANMVSSATPASADPKERRLLVTLARPDLLEGALAPASASGLRLVNASPSPIALYNGVVALGEPIARPTLFVDLGATTTEVVVGDGNGVLFARSFAMGTALLTQAVASHGRLPIQQAERLRLQAPTFAELPGGAPQACEQFVRRWFDELKACIEMYGTSHPQADAALHGILLSGGGSLWTPLREALMAQSPLPMTRVGRMAGHEEMDASEFMIAAGLAAQALGIARAPSSLLPDRVRQDLVRARNKRYWILTGAFAVGAMAMVAASSRISFQRERERLNQYSETLRRCEQIAKDTEAVKARTAQLDAMSLPLVRFVNNSARIRGLTLYIAEHKGRRDFVTLIADSPSYLDLRVSEREERAKRGAPRVSLSQRKEAQAQAEQLRVAHMNRLIVEGFTPQGNLASVKNLIEKLREHPDVRRADLITDDMVFADPERDEAWRSTGGRRFVLDVLLADVAGEGGR
jgi:Tfp pilus assembly PilM family ATPase